MKILRCINSIKNQDIKNFFLLAFAQILKTSSIWLQKSIKPTRDYNKKEADVKKIFLRQSRKMIDRHREYLSLLSQDIIENIDSYATIQCGDCRHLMLDDNSVSLVVTSPPYVTSYEYADLHQLHTIWFGYLEIERSL